MHNAMTPVRLEPAAFRSRVKHSTTEPLRSLIKRPLKYHIFENFMENGAFAHLEQMLHFPYYFQKYSKLT